MDETDKTKNSRQRLAIIDSSSERVRSLSASHISCPELWTKEPEYDAPPISNSSLEIANDFEIDQGYDVNQHDDIDNIKVGPFVSLSSHELAPETPFDINVYQQKKTLAQGMMDLALISANANQMRYVLQLQNQNFYYAIMSMIVMSLILQIIVGIGLIWNSKYNIKKEADTRQANKTNNWTVVGIFLVTIINVFISSFGVSSPLEISTSDRYVNTEDFDALHKENLTAII